ncbi:ABC transporter ATP-binding protein [Streptomyces diastatochromogenes]|nr:ABC transporter ATP-binding protein [Streptomyces diastatochromogenes]
MNDRLLRASGIDVRFGGVHALRDVAVSVGAGEICGLIGPNGAGKTTLFDVLSGMRRPDAGAITYDGRDITGRSSVWRARRGIRRTFQRRQLFGELTVADNLVVAQEWRGGAGSAVRRRRRERAAAVLHTCGLETLAGSYAGGLPVGQARMVELARALVDPPRVLLLDEPVSGMTAQECGVLAAVVRGAAREGCGVLVVEHDVSFVMGLCSRVVVLDRGGVLAEGTAAEVRADLAVREAYLGAGPAGV